jgi:hypothetical protein
MMLTIGSVPTSFVKNQTTTYVVRRKVTATRSTATRRKASTTRRSQGKSYVKVTSAQIVTGSFVATLLPHATRTTLPKATFYWMMRETFDVLEQIVRIRIWILAQAKKVIARSSNVRHTML